MLGTCVGGAEPHWHPSAEQPEVFFGRLAATLHAWGELKRTFINDVNLRNFNYKLEQRLREAHKKQAQSDKRKGKPTKVFYFTPATWVMPHFVDPELLTAILMGSYATVYGWKCPPPSVSHVTPGTETPECGVIDYIFHSTLREMFAADVSIAG